MKNQECEQKNANGNAKARTLRLYIKLRTVRCFANKKSANSLKVSGFLHKKMRTTFAFRGERGSQTYGFLEYHKIHKWLYISHLYNSPKN